MSVQPIFRLAQLTKSPEPDDEWLDIQDADEEERQYVLRYLRLGDLALKPRSQQAAGVFPMRLNYAVRQIGDITVFDLTGRISPGETTTERLVLKEGSDRVE